MIFRLLSSMATCVIRSFMTGPLSHVALFLTGNNPRYYALGVAGPSIWSKPREEALKRGFFPILADSEDPPPGRVIDERKVLLPSPSTLEVQRFRFVTNTGK